MPTTGEVRLNNGADGKPGYSSSFSHDEEAAEPGYYAVTLKDYGVRAELTSTTRVGMHRYRFPAGAPAHVILDLTHRDTLVEASLAVVSDTEVSGLRRSTGWARDQVVYFVIRFSRPFGESAQRARIACVRSISAARAIRCSSRISSPAVSVEGARKNIDAELPGWDFDAARRAASQTWDRALSKIVSQGFVQMRDERVRFYTALYHTMLTPNFLWTRTAAIAGATGRFTRPTASPITPSSRCGTPSARCIRCSPSSIAPARVTSSRRFSGRTWRVDGCPCGSLRATKPTR